MRREKRQREKGRRRGRERGSQCWFQLRWWMRRR
jgi:hypothetical protein